MELEIKYIRYFLHVCKYKSFSNAAKNLYISQQGLSRSIKKLEEYLKVPLFQRTADGIQLTSYGQHLQKVSIPFLEKYDSYLNEITNFYLQKPQKLSICLSFGILNAISMDLIDKFNELHPSIELDLPELPDSYCERVLLLPDININIAITIGPIDTSKFNYKLIRTYYPCVIVNKKNPLSKKSEITFEDLQNEKIIIYNPSFKLHQNFVNKCKQHGFKPNIISMNTEIYLVHKLCRLNKGIGISLDFIAKDFDYSNTCAIPFADKTFTWDIYLIYKKGDFLPESAKLFANYILNLGC